MTVKELRKVKGEGEARLWLSGWNYLNYSTLNLYLLRIAEARLAQTSALKSYPAIVFKENVFQKDCPVKEDGAQVLAQRDLVSQVNQDEITVQNASSC